MLASGNKADVMVIAEDNFVVVEEILKALMRWDGFVSHYNI